MARRGLVYVGVAVGALAASGRAGAAVTITSFPPSSWGASNAALGFASSAIVEDFEDTTLVAGLAYRITGQPMTAPATVLPNTFVPSTDPNGKAFAESVWDGTHVFINTADNLSKRYADVPSWGGVRFAFPEGVTRVGFSLTDMQGTNAGLIVNGDRIGSVGSAPGTTNIQLGSAIRNGYLVIAAGPGERIFDVSIESDFTGDGYAIDHMLIERPVPASAVVFLSDDLAGAVYRYRLTAGGAPVLEATIPSPSAKGFAFRNGEMLVGDYAGGAITRFLSPFGTPRANGRITGVGLMSPEQMTFVNDELWVLNSSATPTAAVPLVRLGFDGQGNASALGTITDGLVGAGRGIVYHPATTQLIVSQCCTVHTIQSYWVGPTDAGALGVTRDQLVTLTATQNPHGMAMAQWHELFVASLDNTILRYTFEDGMLPGTPIRGNDFRSPVGVAFTPWGELLVTNQADGTVARVTFDGARAPVMGGTFQTPASAASRLGWIAVQPLPAGCAPPTAPACQPPPSPDAGGGGGDAAADGGSDAAADAAADASPPVEARDAGGSGDARDAAADRAPDAGRGGSGGGCGCRTFGADGSGAAGMFVLASLFLAARRRRR